jgi:MFS transporter, Spinster family, sphingosine-1-phosphate transporter
MSSPNETAALPKPVKGAYLALALLFTINMLNYVDRYTLAAVGPVAREDLMPNDPNVLTKMGILFGVFMVTYMLFAPLFGWLSDRYSRWRIITLGVVLWSVATWASGFATGFWSMLFFRCLVGVGEAAYGPAAPAILADMFPVRLRGKVIAIFYIAIPVGSALSFLVAGFILEHFAKPGESAWRQAFHLMLWPGLLLAVLCLFMREPKRGEVEGGMVEKPKPPTWADYKIIIQTRSFAYCVLGMTAMTFVMGGIVNWMPEYMLEREMAEGKGVAVDVNDRLQREKALEPITKNMGIVIILSGLLSTLAGAWIGDLLQKKYGGAYFYVSSIGMFLGFACFLAVLFLPLQYAWYAIFASICCLFLNTGPTNTILANVVHPSMRQMAVAICILVIHTFGDVISPSIIGFLAETTGGLKNAFLIISGLIVVSGILWWMGAKYLQKDTELAPTRITDS